MYNHSSAPKSLVRLITLLGSMGRGRRLGIGLFTMVALTSSLSACSLGYYAKGAWQGLRILQTRTPVAEVILDPDTDERTRGKLTLAREALAYAETSLWFRVGGTYSTIVTIPSDTLAHIVSAAHPDRLESYIWSFPLVGSVPYKGFFDYESAAEEEARLAGAGLDTWLRPSGAFSTLGYIEDPIPSTILRYDEVALVETLLHELAHGFLFVRGEVRFNESFAQFVGSAGAAEFFCGREGGGPDTVWCRRAQARWRDQVRFSAFLDPLVDELQTLYGEESLSLEGKLAAREEIFARAFTRFDEELAPELEELTFESFRNIPLNNATLLSRMRYYHRLGDFEALRQDVGGGLRPALASIQSRVESVEDPFEVLSR
jgi:predicted aminopeptidase